MYVGGWANDLRNGYGKNIWKKDGNVYEGFWKQGKREGHGRFYFKDGRRTRELFLNFILILKD